jgi:hypothetical protein
MESIVKNQLLNELENLTRNMDIPIQRQRDFRWLSRNAGINNPNHKNLDKINKICQLLMKEENNV